MEIERLEVPFVFEFADPQIYARALASTGPAFEAIQAVGERSFLELAEASAQQRMREGLPLRAPIALVGYVAVKNPVGAILKRPKSSAGVVASSRVGFLAAPPQTPEAQRLFDDDLDGVGYVMNVTSRGPTFPPRSTSFPT